VKKKKYLLYILKERERESTLFIQSYKLLSIFTKSEEVSKINLCPGVYIVTRNKKEENLL
jgi:hypothetical protein